MAGAANFFFNDVRNEAWFDKGADVIEEMELELGKQI
jgi:hypothetical protein